MGKRIKILRENLKMTQEQLAEKINVSRPALANYECGLREPKGAILWRLAKALGTSTGYLISGMEGEESNRVILPSEITPKDVKKLSTMLEQVDKYTAEIRKILTKANGLLL